MVNHQTTQNPNQATQSALTAQLLQPLLEKRRALRILVLKHASAADVPISINSSSELVCLSSEERAAGAPLYARLSALPFDDVTFDLIVLQHLISDGSEAVLAEATRVLAAGGDIIISGLNHAGLRYHGNQRANNYPDPYPGIKFNKATFHLIANSFTIKRCVRAGIAGMAWPKSTEGWLGSVMPFSDRIALLAQHRSGTHKLRLSSLEKIRSASVSTASFDSVSLRKRQS